MAIIYVTDQEGRTHEVPATVGDSLMVAIRDAGLDIPAICGGNCTCSTCQVYVDDAWIPRLPPPEEEEVELLEEAYLRERSSRLTCQINFEDSLDGLKLTLPPTD